MESGVRIKETIHELASFFRGFLKNSKEVGALFPTSKWVARAMCTPLMEAIRLGAKPKVLEVGAGTGSITRHLLMIRDRCAFLKVVECNDFYIRFLKNKFFKNISGDNFSFYERPIQTLQDRNMYDFIICSIPFLSLNFQTNLQIFEKLRELSHPETIMTFFEHLGFRYMKLIFESEKSRIYRAIKEVMLNEKTLFLNYYPLRVVALRPYFLKF